MTPKTNSRLDTSERDIGTSMRYREPSRGQQATIGALGTYLEIVIRVSGAR